MWITVVLAALTGAALFVYIEVQGWVHPSLTNRQLFLIYWKESVATAVLLVYACFGLAYLSST